MKLVQKSFFLICTKVQIRKACPVVIKYYVPPWAFPKSATWHSKDCRCNFDGFYSTTSFSHFILLDIASFTIELFVAASKP